MNYTTSMVLGWETQDAGLFFPSEERPSKARGHAQSVCFQLQEMQLEKAPTALVQRCSCAPQTEAKAEAMEELHLAEHVCDD